MSIWFCWIWFTKIVRITIIYEAINIDTLNTRIYRRYLTREVLQWIIDGTSQLSLGIEHARVVRDGHIGGEQCGVYLLITIGDRWRRRKLFHQLPDPLLLLLFNPCLFVVLSTLCSSHFRIVTANISFSGIGAIVIFRERAIISTATFWIALLFGSVKNPLTHISGWGNILSWTIWCWWSTLFLMKKSYPRWPRTIAGSIERFATSLLPILSTSGSVIQRIFVLIPVVTMIRII